MKSDQAILKIEELIRKNGSVNGPEVADMMGISRQRAHALLSGMVRTGDLVRIGRTRGARFFPSTEHLPVQGSFVRRLPSAGLKEHEVLQEIRDSFIPLKLASDNVRSIFDYAFSEMLNNAIDHSQSEWIDVETSVRGGAPGNPAVLTFTVRDYGIGAFRNVMRSRGLSSELEAMQDLLKGKITTAPQAHSGQGIFFTSRASDVFTIRSFGWELRVDTTIPDIFFSRLDTPVEGTEVRFAIAYRSKRHLIDIFKAFESDPEMGDFDRTEIFIRLFTHGTIHVSRSQARRVLTGLEKFRRVTLDFDRVPTVGQAFVDEIFRVFLADHPEIQIEVINANEAVQFMIDRVERPPRDQSALAL